MRPTDSPRPSRSALTEEQIVEGRLRALRRAEPDGVRSSSATTAAERQALFARTPRPEGTFEERRERRRRAMEAIDPDCRVVPIERLHWVS